jgi:ABC-type nitrate/sulfonate/bicarbonate transport system permease component
MQPESAASWRLARASRGPALAIAGLAVVFAIWWLIALQLGPARLPTPGEVWNALRADYTNIPAVEFSSFQTGGIHAAVIYTTVNVLIGVAIGSLAGFLVGAVLGSSRMVRELLSVPLMVLSTIPVLVLAPFLVIWFGTSRIVESGLVITFAFVTLAAVVRQATEDVSAHYTNCASSLGAGRMMILREVILPAVVPATIGGVRVALAAGWSFETVAELLGGSQGTGKLIQTLQGMSATADIMAGLAALAIVGVICDAIVSVTGKWVVRWKE